MRTAMLIFFLAVSLDGISQSFSQRIFPDHITVQYAGSTGYLSAGPGYRFFNDKLEAEALYGYVPEKFGGELHIATARVIYQPFKLFSKKRITLTPLMLSAFVTYHFGDKFYIFLPDHYPDGYYKWPSAIRYHGGLGSSVTLKTGKERRHGVTFYYELNTNDLYYKSWMANDRISFNDILMLGLGVKIF